MEPNKLLIKKISVAILILASTLASFYVFLTLFSEIFEIDESLKIIKKACSKNDDTISLILLFANIGLQGSMIRVIFDFIGHTCYTEKFDFDVWWPWYLLRPLLGFIMSAFFVVLFDMSNFNSDGDVSKFPFILAFVTGFAVTDAIDFLRRFSKKIFSISEK
jgi:hypothetical protein